MRCDFCHGLGWTRGGGEWPECCRFCGGKGSLSPSVTAKKLGIHRDTVKRVEEGRARQSTLERVVDAATALLEGRR